jgi:hypothetical protein
MDKEIVITNRVVRVFKGNLTVEAEISNTEKGLYVRLKCGDLTGRWSKSYPDINTLQVGDRLFGYGSAYWEGALPIEQPFEIVTGK